MNGHVSLGPRDDFLFLRALSLAQSKMLNQNPLPQLVLLLCLRKGLILSLTLPLATSTARNHKALPFPFPWPLFLIILWDGVHQSTFCLCCPLWLPFIFPQTQLSWATVLSVFCHNLGLPGEWHTMGSPGPPASGWPLPQRLLVPTLGAPGFQHHWPLTVLLSRLLSLHGNPWGPCSGHLEALIKHCFFLKVFS